MTAVNQRIKEIIVFTDKLGNAGIQRVISELTDVWANLDIKVSVAYMNKEDNDVSDYSWNAGVQFIKLPVSGGFFSTYYQLTRAMVRILREKKDAIAVSLSVMTNFAMGAAALFVKNRVVISDRNDPTKRPSGRIKQGIRNFAFKQADVLVLQTDDVQKYYIEKIKRKGVVIPNPINKNIPERFTGTRRNVIVTASRLNKQKNLPMLINAFARISKEYPQYTLEIYGRGDEENNLRLCSQKSGVADKVLFKGFSSNLFEDILDCGIYVCSSDYEGISNSLIEALGMGLPTISTDCPVGGSRMLIQHGVNGFLIPVGDEDMLYKQLKELIDNPELAELVSKNACAVKDRFSVDIIGQRWLDVM